MLYYGILWYIIVCYGILCYIMVDILVYYGILWQPEAPNLNPVLEKAQWWLLLTSIKGILLG